MIEQSFIFESVFYLFDFHTRLEKELPHLNYADRDLNTFSFIEM